MDCSADALEVAKLNGHRLALIDRVTFIQGDLLSWMREPVDIVVANLPYIPREKMPELPLGVREYEPTLALDGGVGGLSLNLNLIRQIAGHLKSGGHVFLECEPFQSLGPIARSPVVCREVPPSARYWTALATSASFT